MRPVTFGPQTVRELKGAALACLNLLMLCRTPVLQEWLERYSGYTDKPVSQAMAYLSEEGWAVKTKGAKPGWVLADGLQPFLSAALGLSDAQAESETFRLEAGSIKVFNNNESDSLITVDSLLLNQEKERVGIIPTLEIIVKNLGLLFEDPLEITDIPADTSPQLALAWIAKAHTDYQRYLQACQDWDWSRPGKPKGLDNPTGLIRGRLQAKSPRALHLNRLPERYLEAVGLLQKICPLCNEIFTSKVVYDAHLMQPHETGLDGAAEAESSFIAPSVVQVDQALNSVLPGHAVSIRDAWSVMIEKLADDMPRASYDTWARDMLPAQWDSVTQTLTIAVRNAYARDWLTARLAGTLEGHLSAALTVSAHVVFIVAVETPPEAE